MTKGFLKRLLWLLLPALALCFVLFFLMALSNLDQGRALEDKAQLEDALHRAAVSCYAIEGAYPPDLAYLVDNYGVQVDTQRFTVVYQLHASNLMPDITVLDRPQ